MSWVEWGSRYWKGRQEAILLIRTRKGGNLGKGGDSRDEKAWRDSIDV